MFEILINFIMLSYYVLSLWLIYNDDTLNLTLKILYSVASIFVIILLSDRLFNPNPFSQLCLIVGILTLAWYLYSTYHDYINFGYTQFERVFYVSIDLFTIAWLIIYLLEWYVTNLETKVNLVYLLLKSYMLFSFSGLCYV